MKNKNFIDPRPPTITGLLWVIFAAVVVFVAVVTVWRLFGWI